MFNGKFFSALVGISSPDLFATAVNWHCSNYSRDLTQTNRQGGFFWFISTKHQNQHKCSVNQEETEPKKVLFKTQLSLQMLTEQVFCSEYAMCIPQWLKLLSCFKSSTAFCSFNPFFDYLQLFPFFPFSLMSLICFSLENKV